MRDPTVVALLLEELVKHRGMVEKDGQFGLLRAVHGLKGTCGMVDLKDVADAFIRIERRAQAGDARASRDALELIDKTAAALRAGKGSPLAPWPEPPFDLSPMPIEPTMASAYLSATADKLERIDRALSTSASDTEIATEIYREVHALKGSALTVGDEVMAWFCHGLEAVLAAARKDPARAQLALSDMSRYRGVLSEIVEAPLHALETLRVLSGVLRPSARPLASEALPLPPKRPSDFQSQSHAPARQATALGESDPKALRDDEFVRVSSALIDTLYLQASAMGHDRAPLHASARGLAPPREALRASHLDLRHALRLIGPPRPWGAPALALDKIKGVAERVDQLAKELDALSESLLDASSRAAREGDALRSTVTGLRTTHAGQLFERITKAMSGQLRRDGHDVAFVVVGAETPIDRRVADALYDPIVQLIRNTASHGIEEPETRLARGKPATATIHLRADLRAASIAIEVADDGRGVDESEVRRLAVEVLGLKKTAASRLPKATLLSLLFVPGFSTRSGADVFAGRGVGLDLSLAAVHRLGGTITLSSRKGEGFSATILVPREGASARVAWVSVGDRTFGIPVSATRSLVAARELTGALSLSLVIDETASPGAPKFALTLGDSDNSAEAAQSFLVDGIGEIEEVALRPLPPLARLSGPYSACVISGDELRLVLDTHALVTKAAALKS